jgi:FkbM family methyltransferase
VLTAEGVVARLRGAGAHPLLVPATALALRSSTVHGSARFVLRELLRRRSTGEYRLRRNGLTTLIRHVTPDVVTLGEVFHRPDYELPDEVKRMLGCPRRSLRVLDLGANIGLFSLFVLGERPEARIEAFEADPDNAAVLRRVIELNGLSDRWQAIEAAAGAENGEVRFETGRYALSRIGTDAGALVPMVDVLPRVAAADLVKLDIEGGEWAILGDPRFKSSPPPAVVLEYHPHLAPPGRSPRDAVESRLRDCGYALQAIFHHPDGHGMLWGWRS